MCDVCVHPHLIQWQAHPVDPPDLQAGQLILLLAVHQSDRLQLQLFLLQDAATGEVRRDNRRSVVWKLRWARASEQFSTIICS